MIVSNSSPLIAIGRINRFDIFKELFGAIAIPTSVYQETVIETKLTQQREAILKAVADKVIKVIEPEKGIIYRRRLGAGEKGVLDLAMEMKATAVILDDKKARNEAQELGLTLLYTTDILRGADKREIISYVEVMVQLQAMSIFLPEL